MQLCANETVRLLSLNQNEIGPFGLFDLWFDVSPVHVFKEPKREKTLVESYVGLKTYSENIQNNTI